MNYKHLLAALAIFCLAALPRIHKLDAIVSPDEPRWESNTKNFIQAFKTADFKNYYQQPHPGITTQWLASPTIAFDSWGVKRLPLAITFALACVYIAYLIKRMWGSHAGLASGLLLALNPIFIAHSRVLAMDAALATCLVAGIVHYALWLKHGKKSDAIATGIFTSLAILSKLSAIAILPYLAVMAAMALWRKQTSYPNVWRASIQYCIALVVTTVIIFPTVITNPIYVANSLSDFFTNEGFTQQIHALGQWWYPEALLIWTTPLQLIGLILLPFALKKPSKYRPALIAMVIWSVLFFLEIQYATKKGDRYMLPIFTMLDIIAVGSILAAISISKQTITRQLLGLITAMALVWQVVNVSQLHPYMLAYRNPFFKSLALGRTMGWGEGLDIAAAYLNTKPQATQLLVVSYYESSFAYHFKGGVTSAERLAKESATEIGADYVVLYRTMQGRAPERWETKVLQKYASTVPEKIISLNGEEYVWIYNTRND
ncbi:MAG: glycosyltransferase family 39 protein [Candidatus Andersenbacteria bacterium]|nr:glycosyltransferase family 39 protein [Candidatus Andersenbacteria bacterium]